MKIKQAVMLAVSAAFYWCSAGSAGAAKVLIDFGDDGTYMSASAPSPDSNGNYWNSLNYGNTKNNLVDTNNNATTIDWVSDGIGNLGSYNGPAGVTTVTNPCPDWTNAVIDAAALGDLGIKQAAFDWYKSDNGSNNDGRFQLRQLNPVKTYKLTFYAACKYSGTQTKFTLYDDSAYSSEVASVVLAHNSGGANHNSNTVATLTGIGGPSNPGNVLYIKWEGVGDSTEGYINAMSIEEETPEEADETILVDLGSDSTYRSASAPSPDSNSNYWNSTTYGNFIGGLVDIDGNTTEVDWAGDGIGGTDSYNGPAGDTSSDGTPNSNWTNVVIDAVALGDLGVKQAAFDYYTSSAFQIQDLKSYGTYTLTFYGSKKYAATNLTVYSVYTDDGYSNLVDSAVLDIGSGSAHNQDRVAVIRNLTPQTGNKLYVKYEGAGGTNGYLNAFKIERFNVPAAGGDPVAAPAIREWLLDFNDSVTNDFPHGDGNYWNTVKYGAFGANLVDITNGASSIDFGPVSGGSNGTFNNPDGAVDPYILGDLGGNSTNTLATNAVNDYIQASSTSTPGRFQLQSLSASKYYRLSFFASHKWDDGDLSGTTTVSAGSDTNYVNPSVTMEHNNRNFTPSAPATANSERIGVLENVQPNANGKIYVEFTGYLNCMKIEESDTAFPEAGGGTKLLFDIGNDSSARGLSLDGYDENTNLWNSVFAGAYLGGARPKDSAIPTTIGFGWSGFASGSDSYNGPAGATSSTTLEEDVLDTDIDAVALGDLGAKRAAFDYYGDGTDPVLTNRIVLTQCPTDKYFQIELFGSHKYDSDTGGTSTYSVVTSDGTVLDSATLAHNSGGSTHNTDQTATLVDAQAGADGRLYIQWIGFLNAFSVDVTDAAVNTNATGYAAWAANHGLSGGSNDDDDGDGLSNCKRRLKSAAGGGAVEKCNTQ